VRVADEVLSDAEVVDAASEAWLGLVCGGGATAIVTDTVCVAVAGEGAVASELLDVEVLGPDEDVLGEVDVTNELVGLGDAKIVTVAGAVVDCCEEVISGGEDVVDGSTLLPDCHAM
jgi:hypothetical protein